ncbi:MAG: HD domain-containing protein [Candidatus Riflebacteria bacterium]
MTEEKIIELKAWFKDYVGGFFTEEPGFNRNIQLKLDHTMRVCNEMQALSASIGLDSELSRLAEVSALLHDVGRFEQFRQFKTFADRKSTNHASLGLQIVDQFNLLKDFSPLSQSLVKEAIACHNLAEIPDDTKGNALLLAKLLRDADKLDIWKVVAEYYQSSHKLRNKSIELDLPDLKVVSEAVLKDVLAGKIIRNTELKSLNDFKLLQLGWVFDLNFSHSLGEFRKRGYLSVISGAISDPLVARKVRAHIEGYLNQLEAKKMAS